MTLGHEGCSPELMMKPFLRGANGRYLPDVVGSYTWYYKSQYSKITSSHEDSPPRATYLVSQDNKCCREKSLDDLTNSIELRRDMLNNNMVEFGEHS